MTKTYATFWSQVHVKAITNLELQMRSLTMQNLSFYSSLRENVGTQDILLITLSAPPPMSFTGYLAIIAIIYALVKQEDD